MARLEIRLVQGNIVAVDSTAWVLGICQDVTPSGAARHIDTLLDGAISEFSARRMFSGAAGEVFMLPAARHPVPVETVVLAGLGPFDRLTSDVQQFVAENVMRTLIRARIDEFACVLLGARTGQTVEAALDSMLGGFLRGIRDADSRHRFRSITICEIDPQQYAAIKSALSRFKGRSATLHVEALSPQESVASRNVGRVRDLPAAAPPPDPIYLLVRSDADTKSFTLHASLLTAGDKATVISGSREVSSRVLDRHLRKLPELRFELHGPAALRRLGATLSRMLLPPDIVELLGAMRDRHIVVVHDRESTRIPWETLTLAARHQPALAGGVSRRYLASDMPVAKWLERRRREKTLHVLLVADPSGDLPAAAAEGRRLEVMAQNFPELSLTVVRKKDATRAALLELFESGEFDLLHYAGHAFFDEHNPDFSGIVCAKHEPLSGRELSGLGNLPSLVFFNACEAGRIRRSPLKIVRGGGLAEAFLRGGVANYVGTYWEVGDESAAAFAAVFYKELLAGRPLGSAILSARLRLQRLQSIDWADYIHYGDWQFSLKKGDS